MVIRSSNARSHFGRSQFAYIAIKLSRMEDSHSLESLEKEKRILNHLFSSPHILTFLADTVSFDHQHGGWAYVLDVGRFYTCRLEQRRGAVSGGRLGSRVVSGVGETGTGDSRTGDAETGDSGTGETGGEGETEAEYAKHFLLLKDTQVSVQSHKLRSFLEFSEQK
ncbi:hypothetical protein LWI28_021475 [Acer negundo]|uniref:Protein kinase domain-containing protein n=1 Tax=Acer negundo TaxID=4023 RepID=A0AAD5J0U6_ACENE|nr:hypothetical protein LWI28_021475 [Acer negundo]